jgi:hypothetical protein
VYRLIVPVVLLLASHVHAQEPILVYVLHSGSDQVGGQLAYEVREAIRRSAGYQLGTQEKYLLSLNIVSLDIDRGSGRSMGNWSAVAVTYCMYNYQPYKAGDPQTWLPIYLTTSVHTVGQNRTEETAKNIMAMLDQEWEDVKQAAIRTTRSGD